MSNAHETAADKMQADLNARRADADACLDVQVERNGDEIGFNWTVAGMTITGTAIAGGLEYVQGDESVGEGSGWECEPLYFREAAISFGGGAYVAIPHNIPTMQALLAYLDSWVNLMDEPV